MKCSRTDFIHIGGEHSQIRKFMEMNIYIYSSPSGGHPSRNFRNMKCSSCDSRPNLGLEYIKHGGVSKLCAYEYLWVFNL